MKALSERKDLLREALDHDEVRELRLAVQERLDELTKLEKKAKGYGLNAHEFRERKRILEGTDTEPGLLHLLELQPATEDAEQLDTFHENGATPPSEECAHENTRTEPGLAGAPVTVCTDCGAVIPRQLPAGNVEEEEADEIQEADFEVVEEGGVLEGGAPNAGVEPEPGEIQTEDVTPPWAGGTEDEAKNAGDEEVQEWPLLAHELPGVPYQGSLKTAGVTTSKLLELAEAGQLMSIHGIGVGGEEKITAYLVEQDYIDAPEEEEPAEAEPEAEAGAEELDPERVPESADPVEIAGEAYYLGDSRDDHPAPDDLPYHWERVWELYRDSGSVSPIVGKVLDRHLSWDPQRKAWTCASSDVRWNGSGT